MNTSSEIWTDKAYQRIANVESSGDSVRMTFEDGEILELSKSRLLPDDPSDAMWDHVYTDGYEIVVPSPMVEYTIPWTRIRLITDKAFASHWAKKEEEQAQKIGKQLRRLRKARKLTAKEVAERAGISPQSLSRIETGKHDVVFSTLRRILGAMGSSLRDLAAEAEGSPDGPISFHEYIRRVKKAGLKREWLLDHLIPAGIVEALKEAEPSRVWSLLEAANTFVERIYGWDLNTVFENDALLVDSNSLAGGLFKLQGTTVLEEASAYAVFAHYLALLTLDATTSLETKPIPSTPAQIRRAILEEFDDLSFESALKYVWSAGIPVLPLRDSGAFHGACWLVDNRPIVVLKQVTPYQNRWLFDLVHELAHVTMHLGPETDSFIEDEEITPFSGEDELEEEANDFATDLLLFGRAEELSEIAVEYASGRLEFLKSAVLRVAAAEHVPVDTLANYLAYRLSMQGENWWGAANNLQITEPSPWAIARSEFIQHVDLDLLSEEDRHLLLSVLSSEEA